MDKLDVQWVRQQFSLPDKVAFFDNAGGSFTLRRVIDRVSAYMQETPIQTGATHELSMEAARRQREAVAAMARMINAEPGEIVIGPSSSALIDRLARAFRRQLPPGSNVIVTEFDHEANISPWLRLREFGIDVRFWRLNRDSRSAEVDDLRSLLDERTGMVACTHATNILGDLMPVEEIAALAHDTGARVMIDGVAFAPHRGVDVKALDVDFYVFSLYKTFGPHIGLLYGRRELLEGLDNINLEHLPADAIPYKFQPGGTPYELVYGAAGIPAYLEELGDRLNRNGTAMQRAFDAVASHEQALGEVLLQYLDSSSRVNLFGHRGADAGRRLPIYSFVVEGTGSRELVTALDPRRLAVRHGNFHAARLIDALGLDRGDGVVRVSMAHYNTPGEVHRLGAAILEAIAAR